jgi:hypothetical protein
MRALFGNGTPKGLADALSRLILAIMGLLTMIFTPELTHVRSLQPVWLGKPVEPMEPVAG